MVLMTVLMNPRASKAPPALENVPWVGAGVARSYRSLRGPLTVGYGGFWCAGDCPFIFVGSGINEQSCSIAWWERPTVPRDALDGQGHSLTLFRSYQKIDDVVGCQGPPRPCRFGGRHVEPNQRNNASEARIFAR